MALCETALNVHFFIRNKFIRNSAWEIEGTHVSEMEQAEPGDQRKETNKTYVLVFHFLLLGYQQKLFHVPRWSHLPQRRVPRQVLLQ